MKLKTKIDPPHIKCVRFDVKIVYLRPRSLVFEYFALAKLIDLDPQTISLIEQDNPAFLKLPKDCFKKQRFAVIPSGLRCAVLKERCLI